MKKKYVIGWLTTLITSWIIFQIPTSDIFTDSVKLFLMITLFVILIIAFELLPRIISALLLPILYSLSGIVVPSIAFSSWLTPTVGIVFGGLLFCTILSECGIFKRIAYYMILLFGGTYKGAVFGCFIMGTLLNIITFCNAWLVAGSLIYGVCQAMELKPSKESAILCFAGIVGASGSTVFLYYPGYYMILENCIRYFIPDYHMSIFSSFIYNGVGFVIFAVIILGILQWSRIDLSHVKDGKSIFQEKYNLLGPFTKQEKYSLIGVIVLISYLFIATIFQESVLYGFIIIPSLVLFITMRKESFQFLFKIDYSIVIFVSSCLGIGIVGKEIGFDIFLLEISKVFLVNENPLVVLSILLLCGMFANFFMTPYAMLGGLSIPFVEIGLAMHIHPLCVLMTLLWSCEILFFPYESAGYLIMYGYGMISMKDFIKYNFIKSIIMLVSFVGILYPLWNVLGLVFN